MKNYYFNYYLRTLPHTVNVMSAFTAAFYYSTLYTTSFKYSLFKAKYLLWIRHALIFKPLPYSRQLT